MVPSAFSSCQAVNASSTSLPCRTHQPFFGQHNPVIDFLTMLCLFIPKLSSCCYVASIYSVTDFRPPPVPTSHDHCNHLITIGSAPETVDSTGCFIGDACQLLTTVVDQVLIADPATFPSSSQRGLVHSLHPGPTKHLIAEADSPMNLIMRSNTTPLSQALPRGPLLTTHSSSSPLPSSSINTCAPCICSIESLACSE